jgi:uncharacterized Zn finger protein
MRLKDLTRGYIENFTGFEIFGRGEEYYRTRRVTNLDYDADEDIITADVSGNYGNYSVAIYAEDGIMEADCDCPYDGYPCKHVAAVLLEFVENKGNYIKKMTTSKTQDSTMKDKMAELPKEELLDIIIDCAKKYPDFKSELMVRFAENKQSVIDTIRKQIIKAFPSVESDSYSVTQVAKRLKTMARQVDAASDDMKIDVHWAITDRVLKELNDYGIDDEALENIAIDSMEKLVLLFEGKTELKQKKQEIIEKLMEYYEWGNCGMVDSIYDTAYDLLESKSDYQIVINHLEKGAKSSTNRSYYTQLLAELYEEIGDDEASLKALENNLHYGMDYWRLAQYWIDKGNDYKALEIVKEGLEKGEGRKEELYLYMREYYEKRKDHDALLALFESKIKEYKSGFYAAIKNDEIYKDLMHYYETKGNYAGVVNLLKLRLEYEGHLDFAFYKEAKDELNEQDWQDFEKKFITTIKRSLYIDKNALLAEIYDYQENIDELWKVVKGSSELLTRYEDKLFPIHSEEYLELYKKIVTGLINNRGRGNYQLAAKYAERIKHLYCEILKESDKWESYILDLRVVNKQLRAMQEEFHNL